MKISGLLTGRLSNSKFKSSQFGYFLTIGLYVLYVLLILTSCSGIPSAISKSQQLISTKTYVVPTIKPVVSKTKIFIESKIPPTEAVPENYITPNEIKVVLSSPLRDIKIEELPLILSNPFQFPSKGKDDGHPGIDLSFYTYRNWDSINNLDVQSIFPGKISGIINDRPPYGNAIIIETELYSLGVENQEIIQPIYPDNPLQEYIILNCPDHFDQYYNFSINDLSLYVLYGHLSMFKEFKIGDTLVSGNIIGQVGNTGYSGNPHLHLEMRIGPKSATFQEMAHYDNSVTPEEIENYCLWRVSGYFYPIDPFLIMTVNPTKP